jgi:hypothetical protein
LSPLSRSISKGRPLATSPPGRSNLKALPADDLRVVGNQKELPTALLQGVRQLHEPGLDFAQGHEIIRLVEAQDLRPAHGDMEDGV